MLALDFWQFFYYLAKSWTCRCPKGRKLGFFISADSWYPGIQETESFSLREWREMEISRPNFSQCVESVIGVDFWEPSYQEFKLISS